MSDNWIRVIPTDLTFIPEAPAAARARDLLDQFAPADSTGAAAREASATHVVFIDAGSNFERVMCPSCDAEIDPAWWLDRMDAAASSEFRELGIRTPCCDALTGLDSLRYEWPQGFARWWLEVMNPCVGSLTELQLKAIGDAVGHRVRAIYTHY